MQVNGNHFRSIWLADAKPEVLVIDQTLLPFAFEIRTLDTVSEIALAIRNMVVRGAPLIGATAACGPVCSASRRADTVSASAASAAAAAAAAAAEAEAEAAAEEEDGADNEKNKGKRTSRNRGLLG